MAPIATLTVRLGAQIAEFQSEFKDATKSAQKFADDFQGVATKAATIGAFFGTIAADIASSLARGFAGAIRDAVKFSSEFHNAFIGLGSVARAFGTDTDAATTAARKLSADGLLPLKDSATGLKNLLAAGFNLDQSTKLMNAFKDSAAFGRQGALSFGDAIRSATEGVKNGNSILVDNAGVTKNLSQILKEAGFSAQDLSKASSDVGVRMALFNGILKETRAQTGDAAKLTQTYTGQMTRLESQYHTLLASLGDAITQNKSVAIAIGFVGDAVQHLTMFLSENHRGFNIVSDAVILLAKSMSAALGFIDLFQTGFAGLQVTFDETARAGLKMAQDILTVASVAAHLRATLDPVFGDEWKRKALLADAMLAGVTAHMEGFAAASQEATDRSIRWGNTLQTGRARLDGLVTTLEAARGQTVTFGDAQGVVLDRTEKLTGAQKAAILVTSEMTQVLSLLEKAHQHQAAALKFEESAWKSWEATVSKALSHIPTSPVLLQGRDLSGVVPQVGAAAAGAGNLAHPAAAAISETLSEAMARSLQQLPQMLVAAFTGGGGLKGAVAGMGTLLGSTLGESIGKGFKALGKFGGPIGEAIGALAGPLIEKIFGMFGTAGRTPVVDFAGTFGGFDALHAKLLELGAEGEQLWIKLTQGVGRNNSREAQAAIDAVTAALDRHKAAQDKVSESATAAGIAQSEATKKAQAAIDALTSKIDSLQQSIANEAPEEVMGIIEANTRAQIKAIEDERTAAQAALDDTTKSAAEAAKQAGDIIDVALAGREFHIRVKVDLEGLPGGTVPAMASGGIVRRKTLALVGESGPEAVIPLSRMGRGFGGMPNLDVTLRLPNNQILLRQFVQGLKAEGLA